ncbi:MAG: hypothetical protein GWP91_23310, partial [Rhodobacterales bacterium]|nr:hypothetical protein [Rhodobacterales bacterium]
SLAAVAPAMGIVQAGPSLWGWWISLVSRIRDARARRREADLRPPTAVEQLAALPSDPALRLAALDGLLRLALAVREDVPSNELDRAAAIANLPEDLAQRTAALVQQLDRARFADGPPPSLATDLEQLIRDLEPAP